MVKQKEEVEAKNKRGRGSKKVAGRKSGAVTAYLQIQVRVPGQYVA
jgi:hypothetical protein